MLERATEIDPEYLRARTMTALVLQDVGRYEEALQHARAVIDAHPDFSTAYWTAALAEHTRGNLVEAMELWMKAYELSSEPESAYRVYMTARELGDDATAAAWLGRVAGNAYWDMLRTVSKLGKARDYAQAFAVLARGIDGGPGNFPAIALATHLALILGQPERAEAILIRRYRDLAVGRDAVNAYNCDAAVTLAAAWQRIGKDANARRLLREVAAWVDDPRAPRWPEASIVRAQVHALLGERELAFKALDRAFDKGFRGTLGQASLALPYHGEDSPLFASLRDDPRFAAWLGRIRADNARQLAKRNRSRSEPD